LLLPMILSMVIKIKFLCGCLVFCIEVGFARRSFSVGGR